MKTKRHDMDSKYFGRAIRKWRVVADLSQDELAERSGVSSQVIGVVEREKGRFSADSLAKICLGLESKLGVPMLARVYRDGATVLWQELVSIEEVLRRAKGWETVEYGASGVSPEEMDKSFDSASAEARKYIQLLHRAVGHQVTAWDPLPPPDGVPEEQPRSRAGKVRVRKSRKKT